LTNLNAKEEVFSELLQEDFTVDKLLMECKKMEENKEIFFYISVPHTLKNLQLYMSFYYSLK